jgi:hypothetical protein
LDDRLGEEAMLHAAISTMRRVLQDGQARRALHEKAIGKSSPQSLQRARTKPRARIPQSRYLRKSRSRALRYVAERWGIPLAHILVAGGSGADEDMMRGNTLAVVVANRGEPGAALPPAAFVSFRATGLYGSRGAWATDPD